MIEVNGVLDTKFLDGQAIPKPGVRIVKFRRVNHQNLVVHTENGPKEKHTSGFGIPCGFSARRIVDKAANSSEFVEVRYYTSKSVSTINGVQNAVYEPTSLDVKGNELILDMRNAEHLELFKVLMMHPLNATNAKDLGKVPLFEMYDEQAASKKKSEIARTKATAIALAYDEDKLGKGACEKIHAFLRAKNTIWTPTEYLKGADDYETMRVNLAEYAEKHPADFLKYVSDHNTGLRAEIAEAQAAGIIKYSADKREWLWNKTAKTRNNKLILTAAVGEDETSELVNFFATDKTQGKRAMDSMREELATYKESVEVAA